MAGGSEGGSLVVKEDGSWGGEQGREVGVQWWHAPELNHKVGMAGRAGLKMPNGRGDD